MRWPWRRAKRETRSAGGYTALMALARAEVITGARGAAELTATVQACVSLWEGALALADVTGAAMLRPALLAHMGRSLALRGEWLALIEGDRLTPAADWDVTTIASAPRAYRLTLPDEGGGRSLTALAPEVVHVVIGADLRSPWRGSSPLQRCSLSADLLATVEAALGDVFGAAPLGSTVVPMPEMPDNDRERLAGSFRGARGRVLLRESVTTTAAGGPAPVTDWRPHSLSPELRDTMALETLQEAKRAVANAYGVHPALLAPEGAGTGMREAQRHLAKWTLAPICALVGGELSDKLGAPVTLDATRPLQAFDAGGRARAAATIVKALADAREAGLDPATIAKAFAQVDWTL